MRKLWSLCWKSITQRGCPGWLSPQNRGELHAALMKITTGVCPFTDLPNSKKTRWNEGITAEQMEGWAIPRLVAQIGFSEWTTDGNLRNATFEGLRPDKPTGEVRECPEQA